MKILLLDKETTGLEEGDGHVPIEVAARVIEPGKPPRELGRFHSLIKPLLGAMANANSFAVDMHKSSGLLDAVTADGVPHLEDVEKALMAFVTDFVPDDKEKLVLMGNSIHFDRRFIKKYMPKLHKRLHYHMLDVTSISIFQQLFGVEEPWGEWEKKKAHTADADLDETWYEAELYARNLGLLDDE
jgi:oligoribonuclease